VRGRSAGPFAAADVGGAALQSASLRTLVAGTQAPPRHRRGRPGRRALVEFEYRRGGTLTYLAAWDVHHTGLLGRCGPTTGIVAFGHLVELDALLAPLASREPHLRLAA
jgi:hypothetical protein